jgi:hypothetical protein
VVLALAETVLALAEERVTVKGNLRLQSWNLRGVEL